MIALVCTPFNETQLNRRPNLPTETVGSTNLFMDNCSFFFTPQTCILICDSIILNDPFRELFTSKTDPDRISLFTPNQITSSENIVYASLFRSREFLERSTTSDIGPPGFHAIFGKGTSYKKRHPRVERG